MTSAQHQFYLRRWAAVVRANHWRMVKGRLSPDAILDRSQHHAAVASAASHRALQQHRALTADDLRHGCHVVALGRDKSSKDFTNREFDKLLTLWGDGKTIRGLLLDPLDLGSEIHRSNPDLKTRDRHLHFLQHECLGGYVVSESERIFHTKEWQALPTDQLIQLSDHLRARPNALRSSIGQRNVGQRNEAPAFAYSSDSHSPDNSDPDWNV